MSRPFLVKTYHDVVGPRGEWAIAYDGRLDVGVGSIGYRELTASSGGSGSGGVSFGPRGEARDRRTFPGRGIAATWARSPIAPTLAFEDARLRWELTDLRGSAKATTAGGAWEGLGYSERLTLKVAPWRLGLHALRWGRYLSDSRFVTWIVAEGRGPIRFGVLDAQTTAEVEADDRRVRVGSVELEIGARLAEVTDGGVFTGRTRLLRGLATLLGGAGFDLRQRKGVFTCGLTGPGWREAGLAMIEHVSFDGSAGRQP